MDCSSTFLTEVKNIWTSKNITFEKPNEVIDLSFTTVTNTLVCYIDYFFILNLLLKLSVTLEHI